MPTNMYDPEFLEALPKIKSIYTPSKNEKWTDIAKKAFDLERATLPAGTSASEVAVDWLKSANPNKNEIVEAGDTVLIPEVPGIRPLLTQITPPKLPDPPSPPPDPTPPVDPPLGPPEDTVPQQVFQDQTRGHGGCYYVHSFYTRKGPIQTLEFVLGTVVWVKYMGYISTGVGPASVSGLSAMYSVFEAKRLLLRRWQWQEIWDHLERHCPPAMVPDPHIAPPVLDTLIRGSGKWVRLPDKEVRGDPREIKSDRGGSADSRMKEWADKYAKADPTVQRGPDEGL